MKEIVENYFNGEGDKRQKNMDLLLAEIAGLKGEVGELTYEVMRTRAMVARVIDPKGGEQGEKGKLLMEVAGKDVAAYVNGENGGAACQTNGREKIT